MVRKQQEVAPGDGYTYDFRLCTVKNGWAQMDTWQDAWYYGLWANPTTRQVFEYCEGDTTLTTCDTDAEFIAEIRKTADYFRESGCGDDGFRGIDPGLPPVVDGKFDMEDENEISKAFRALGLGDLLH